MRNVNEEKMKKIWEKWLYIPNPQSVVKIEFSVCIMQRFRPKYIITGVSCLMKEQRYAVYNCPEDLQEAMKEHHCHE